MTILHWSGVEVGMIVQGIMPNNSTRSSPYFQPNVVIRSPGHITLRVLSPEGLGWYVNDDCRYEELI